jgi:hypothetical protein
VLPPKRYDRIKEGIRARRRQEEARKRDAELQAMLRESEALACKSRQALNEIDLQLALLKKQVK